MIDVKTLRPIFKPKHKKVKDPIRYPKVIDGYENEAKRRFDDVLNVTFVELVKKIVEFKKE